MEKRLTNRDIESIRKKKKIYNAAMKLFQTYGYEQVTMKMISAESEMSEGSIYHYFGEKAGILDYVIVESQEEPISILIDGANNNKSPKEVILAYLCKELDLYENLGRDLVAIATKRTRGTTSSHAETVSDLMEIIQPALTAYIGNYLENGKLSCSCSADEAAYILTAQGSGLTNIWCSYGEHYSLRELGENAFRILIDSLFDEL